MTLDLRESTASAVGSADRLVSMAVDESTVVGVPSIAPTVVAGASTTLFVASTGGHLEELWRLSQRLGLDPSLTHWATFADPQSASLLAGHTVHRLRYVRPRGYWAAASNLKAAVTLLQRGGYHRIVSTGAGIAVPFLSAGRLLGLDCHYVESAARASGPSLTGKIVATLPGVRLYTQYAEWASSRWQFRGSVFDQLRAEPATARPAQRVVITLGTMRTYGFRSAVTALMRVLPEVTTIDADILWQVGATDMTGLNIESRALIPADELRTAMDEADLVVAHAGVGSALNALESGHVPVLLPRRRALGEHVDDHQQMIATRLADRRLAVTATPSSLRPDHLWEAMHNHVLPERHFEPFVLNNRQVYI